MLTAEFVLRTLAPEMAAGGFPPADLAGVCVDSRAPGRAACS